MSSPVVRTYTPLASAKDFHECPRQVKAICGPVGSGKSTIACVEFFLLCQEATVPIRGLVMRESYRQLHDSTRKTWDEWFGPISQYLKSEETMKLTMPGADGIVRTHELHFRHGRREEEASQFMSTEYAFIWLEEVVPAFQVGNNVIGAGLPKGVFDVAMMRQRQKGAHRLHVICTFNPPNKHHWTYREFFAHTPAEMEARDYALFRQPAYENKKNLPPRYYEKLLSRLSKEMADRFVRGDVVTVYPGESVYPECSEQVHIVDELEPQSGFPLIIGFDFGLTPVALIGQNLTGGKVRFFREVQLWNAGVMKLAEELSRVLKDEFPGFTEWRCWGDPAGSAKSQTDETTCFEVLAAKGFPVQPGAIDLSSRKEAVKQRLERFIDGEPGVLIDRHRCPILSEGMLGGYRYPKTGDGRLGSNPLKNDFSHVVNAAEYILTGEFSITTGKSRRDYSRREKIPGYDPFAPAGGGGQTTWMSR